MNFDTALGPEICSSPLGQTRPTTSTIISKAEDKPSQAFASINFIPYFLHFHHSPPSNLINFHPLSSTLSTCIVVWFPNSLPREVSRQLFFTFSPCVILDIAWRCFGVRQFCPNLLSVKFQAFKYAGVKIMTNMIMFEASFVQSFFPGTYSCSQN